MYVVYKENDVLKRVETVNVNDDFTAEFTIPNELKNAEISVYIWNDQMNPYMDIQQITSLATKNVSSKITSRDVIFEYF